MAELSIRTRNAAAGLAWVRAGMRLFARRPLVIVVLVALGPMLIWSLGLVPIVGTPFALILVPAISIGMLSVCRAVDEGAMPGLASYTAALRDPVARLRLLKIGVYYALVVGALVTAMSFLPDGSSAPSGASPPPGASGPAETSPAPSGAPVPEVPDLALTPTRLVLFLASLVIWVPLQMTVWFAPALVAWHQLPASKALFFSFFACWRNRAPMLVYLLALLGLVFLAVIALAALIGALNAKETFAQYLLAPLPLLLLAITQTSTLAMYRDVVDDGSNLRRIAADEQEPSAPA